MFDMCRRQQPSLLIRDKPVLSSERILHKDYDRNGLVSKKKENSGL
jgi:hypothetical protein